MTRHEPGCSESIAIAFQPRVHTDDDEAAIGCDDSWGTAFRKIRSVVATVGRNANSSR